MNARTLVVVLGASLSAAGAAGCKPSQPSGTSRAPALYATCASCHGADGGGRPEYEAPAIAGLDAWYVEAQLIKFRTGARGAHPDDAAGLRMRPMSRTLQQDGDVALIAAYVAAMPPVERPATLAGDAAHGRELFQTCAQCHGEGAAGNRERNAPPLRHANDWYLAAQLGKFKAGIRGTAPADTTGAQMRPMALGLADDAAIRDVVAFIGTLPD